jgi:D-ribulokinase
MNTPRPQRVVLGIDLGTQGMRVLAVEPAGNILATAKAGIPFATGKLPPGWLEQNPRDWWRETCHCTRQIAASLPKDTVIDGLAVDSTSGTILPIDARGRPLHPAILYSDNRSQAVVAEVRAKGAGLENRLGYSFGSSFALPKIYWFKQERSELFAQAAWFVHAADFINLQLTGEPPVTDFSNALKTGYDLIDERWPDFIEEGLGIPHSRLPRVVPSGIEIGRISAAAANETGLPVGTRIYSGATDGTAAQIASGAVEPGAWNSSLGTTLVLKGISRELILDPQRRIYSHRHPEGSWMPGGASNTGTEWILHEVPDGDLRKLDEQAAAILPTALVRYPLARQGERFPFTSPAASGFTEGAARSGIEAYAAGLEGLAMVERLCYETILDIGIPVGTQIFTTGGGSRSRIWTELRATALNRQMIGLEVEDTAMGAALLAARGAWYGSLQKAAGEMVRTRQIIDPNPVWQVALDEKYAQFLDYLGQKGFLER